MEAVSAVMSVYFTTIYSGYFMPKHHLLTHGKRPRDGHGHGHGGDIQIYSFQASGLG